MRLHIATWNVNSLRSRIEHVLNFLKNEAPDVVLIQETKVEDAHFPREAIEELGYNLAIHGQKTYNGVAILSRLPLEDVTHGLAGETIEQARYIEASISLPHNQSLRVASVYVPNGQAVDSDKFTYKLNFLQNLRTHAESLLSQQDYLVIGGDYNVAPYPIDVFDPAGLDGSVCYHPAEREQLRALMNQGLYDAFRCLHPQEKQFSWWDYRANQFARNHGLRIDHLLLNARAIDRLVDCAMHRHTREAEKPSDHIPVSCTLSFIN